MDTHTQQNEGQLSKKQRRELRRQEARAQRASAARGRGLRRILTWGIVVAVLVGIGWLVWRAAQNAPTGPGDALVLTVPVSADDNARGPENAPVTLVEYGDYQCPACAAFHPVIEQILEESPEQIRFVFRHFPLKGIHPNAEMASWAVQAAALQGKFWEMHSIVFERQTEWAAMARSGARNRMLEYATELGMDAERLDRDMDSDAVQDKVDADTEGGEDAGVNSTPSFFVNGQRISGFTSLEDFRNRILGGAVMNDEPNMESHDDADSMGEDL